MIDNGVKFRMRRFPMTVEELKRHRIFQKYILKHRMQKPV
jgi:hypothetical protein